MSEHCEEQEMEAEALTAIFDDCMEVISASQPFEWAIRLWPEQHVEDDDNEAPNHVGIKVIAKIPLDYPEGSLPELKIEVLKGLTTEHEQELLEMAMEEAENNRGMPAIYAICERLREWLLENNVKGMDDVSMYAQMMKREKEKEREAQKAQLTYESQKQKEELTEAELEELAVRKRRAEGTPCTDETFYAWREKFEKEMEAERQKAEEEAAADSKKKGGKGSDKKTEDRSGRLTGFQQFSGKTGALDLEAMEAATENAQRDEDEEEDDNDGDDLDVNEELFDVDDEDLDDLDDLDFDDDDDDDEEEEPDI